MSNTNPPISLTPPLFPPPRTAPNSADTGSNLPEFDRSSLASTEFATILVNVVPPVVHIGQLRPGTDQIWATGGRNDTYPGTRLEPRGALRRLGAHNKRAPRALPAPTPAPCCATGPVGRAHPRARRSAGEPAHGLCRLRRPCGLPRSHPMACAALMAHDHPIGCADAMAGADPMPCADAMPAHPTPRDLRRFHGLRRTHGQCRPLGLRSLHAFCRSHDLRRPHDRNRSDGMLRPICHCLRPSLGLRRFGASTQLLARQRRASLVKAAGLERHTPLGLHARAALTPLGRPLWRPLARRSRVGGAPPGQGALELTFGHAQHRAGEPRDAEVGEAEARPPQLGRADSAPPKILARGGRAWVGSRRSAHGHEPMPTATYTIWGEFYKRPSS